MAQGARHRPTKATRELVQLHTAIGNGQDAICAVLQIEGKTLRTHYRHELDTSIAQANAVIGGVLFNKAKDGNLAAAMFWLKTRGGFVQPTAVPPQQKPVKFMYTRATAPKAG